MNVFEKYSITPLLRIILPGPRKRLRRMSVLNNGVAVFILICCNAALSHCVQDPFLGPVDALCDADLKLVVDYALQRNFSRFSQFDWRFKMWDATGKIPDGLFDGNFQALGSGLSCKEINADFRGKYCIFSLEPKQQQQQPNDKVAPDGSPRTFTEQLVRQGMCFPDSCSDVDVYNWLIREVSDNETFWEPFMYGCEADSDFVTLDPWDWVFMAVVLTLVFAVISATLMDISMTFFSAKVPQNSLTKCLSCFSLKTNARSLMNTEKIQGSGQLYCMNGMRFLTMTWIIIGHTEDSYTLLSWTNYIDDFNRNPASLALEPIYGFNFSVDTFFFMSGCLVAYITFQQLDALKDSSTGEWLKYWSLFYVHRLWRLTFPYLFVVTFTATWGEFLEFGPLKYITVFGREMCQSLWFRNLLYVNNFWTSKPDEREYTEYFYHYVYDRNYQCIDVSWYLSTEMQLFIVSPLFIYPIWRFGKKVKILTTFIWTIVAIGLPLIVTAIYDWPINISRTLEPIEENYFKWFYTATWMRFGGYLAGLQLGHILYVFKKKKIVLSWYWVVLGWSLAAAGGLGVMYGQNMTAFYNYDDLKSGFENAIYAGFSKYVWGLACAWVIFACHKNYGGIVNSLLSWKVFIPLAKACYVCFLIHMTCFTSLYAHIRYAMEWENFNYALLSITLVVVSFITSGILYLIIEIPFVRLDKLLLSSKRPK